MAAGEIRLGDVKTRLNVTVQDGGEAVDISTATVKKLRFQKPDKSIVEKTATFGTNGSDGVIYYETEAGFLDQTGVWTVQAYIELGLSGVNGKWHSDPSTFTVHPNLPAAA